jgi:hypothetical protein
MALAASPRVWATEGLTARPYSPRSGPAGKTRFTMLPAQQLGVVTQNMYDDPKMWGERYQEFALGSMGTGIAIGDYDNDGKPDLFIVSKTSPCRLFHNLGNWKFEDVTEKAGLAPDAGWLGRAKNLMGSSEGAGQLPWQQGAAFVDVNNDGWLDLYVCRFNAPNFLYINQHDGTFKEEAAARGLAVVDASGMGAFCDYDRDGWLDVYLQTNMLDAAKQAGGRRDYLFHNNGDGTFTNVTDRAGIHGDTLAHSSTWWDFDEDGWPDIYVANDFAGPDHLYRNNRDGTFTDVLDAVVPHTPYSSMGADFGDLNNDGRIDMFVADMAATTHERDQRGMATSRELNTEDLSGAAPQYPRNALLLNTGTGHMREAAFLAGLSATDWTWSVRFEDLDNDGRLDMFVTNGMNREYQNADLRERIILTENLEERMRIMKGSPTMRERHFAMRNRGDLQFEDVSAAWGLDQVSVSFGAAFGDLDGDGDLDLVYSNYDAGVTILRNDTDSGHSVVIDLRGTRSNRFGLGAIVRIETAAGPQVRALIPARGYLSSSEPVVHFGLGDSTSIKRLTVEWPSGARQTFNDVPADQRLTITEPAGSADVSSAPSDGGGMPGLREPKKTLFEDVSGPVGLALSTREKVNSEANVQRLRPTRFTHRGPALAAADLNRDDRIDFVLGSTSGEPTRVALRQPDGTFQTSPLAAGRTSVLPDGPILVFDANGDGANDILITRGGTASPTGSLEYQPQLLIGDGAGKFEPASAGTLPDLPISAGAVAAADFDRDGTLDLFIGGRVQPGKYPTPPRSALLANRGGKFEDVTASAPGLQNVGMVTAALWSDVDADGWLDLVLALEWGQVKYFHNDAGKGFTDRTTESGFASAGTGWWTSLATAEFNGDGRPDFVVGNTGLNTMYSASAEQPTLLYYSDFAKNGPLIIEAYYEGNRLYPRRGRNELAQYIPSVRQRYRRNDLYARATLPEIVGEPALQAAHKFAATELRSGVLMSQPDGTYRFEPLPRIAQIAPAQGIAAGDFDGDGHADIYVLQNSYAPIPPIGHFDGGISQLLTGDGHGHFEPVESADSGLVVPGDGKALAVTDLNADGWPDFVLTVNNGKMSAYRNTPRIGRHSLRVALRSGPPNVAAIGARVQLQLRDGAMETAEIAAGSSYYSQAEPACYFGWADANPPAKVLVRWPNGNTTEHTVATDAKSVVIEPR